MIRRQRVATECLIILLDIDWEYPGAYDRGGDPADTANYVTFMKALKTAFGSNYDLSFTAPSSYW